MKQYFIVTFMFGSILFSNAQSSENDFSIGLGIGPVYSINRNSLGTFVDIGGNFFLNKYSGIEGGFGLTRGKFDSDISFQIVQFNADYHFFPWKNEKKNKFSVASGLSLMSGFKEDVMTTPNAVTSRISRIFTYGLNLALEDSYSISSNFSIGLKMFTQIYLKDQANSVLLMNFRFRL